MGDYKTIKMEYEQIDAIVIGVLKETLETEIDNEYDKELVDDLKRVLKYFMCRSEYDSYIRELALTELTRINENLGLYDDQGN